MQYPHLHALEHRTLLELKKVSTNKFPLIVVACVSGGADSMALLHILKELCEHRTSTQIGGLHLTVLHCNHERRGDESDLDEALVHNVCAKWNVSLHVEKWHDRPENLSSKNGNFQEDARLWRYESANKIMQEQLKLFSGVATACIATAHHARDHAETLLLNIIRGTGLDGLSGIDSWNREQSLVRPLCCIRHQEIVAYVQEKKIPFREDSSNASNEYTRNFIRNRILPLIEELNPNYEDSFLRLSENARDALNEIHIPEGGLPIHVGLSASQILKLARRTHPDLPRQLTSRVLSNILGHVRTIATRKNPTPTMRIQLSNDWLALLGADGLNFERAAPPHP